MSSTQHMQRIVSVAIRSEQEEIAITHGMNNLDVSRGLREGEKMNDMQRELLGPAT